eukprot:scaffold60015_cov63-Phaeocystis_antarctica.AAC.2
MAAWAAAREGLSTMLPHCPAAVAARTPWVCTRRMAGGELLCAPNQAPLPPPWGRRCSAVGVRGAEAPFPPRQSQSWAWAALHRRGACAATATAARTPCEAAGRAARRAHEES